MVSCRFPTQCAVGRGCAIPLQNKEVLSNEGQTIDILCAGSGIHAQRSSNTVLEVVVHIELFHLIRIFKSLESSY